MLYFKELSIVMLGAAFASASYTNNSVTCSNTQLSCHNTTAQTDTCCFESPGGTLLQVQLWDTDPSTGPTDSWTIHGLWPDNCDGTYNEYCDATREYTNITAILKYYGQTELLDYINTYWVSDDETNEEFWEHEWAAHGTCISTLDTDCYVDYTTGEELVDFFQKVVDLFKSLPTYKWLSDAGIVPSETTTYTSAEIQKALTSAYGYSVTIACEDDAIYQVEYYYNVKGSVQRGEFVETTPVDSSSSCPTTGVKYLPKSSSSSTTTTATGH